MRHLLSRKTWFYRFWLPLIYRIGPDRADRVLGALGRVTARRQRLARQLSRAREAIGANWSAEEGLAALSSNLLRFAARDYPLQGLTDAEALSRFEVSGLDHLQEALDAQRGVILLGSHFGAYLAGVHWLGRRRLPMRLFVQRPHHVSAELQRMFDQGWGTPLAQGHFFLKRRMSPGEGARKLWLCRAALQSGLAVYFNGDVAWPSGCARPASLLGRRRCFLSAWADLASMTGAAVVPLFCGHRPGGRFALRFLGPWRIQEGDEARFVGRYFRLLESAIARDPAEAVAYLTWKSFVEDAGSWEDTGPIDPPEVARADGTEGMNRDRRGEQAGPLAIGSAAKHPVGLLPR